MKISETMAIDVCMVSPERSIGDAARLMIQTDCGALPVGKGDRLVGMITDRDIAVRAVAANKGPNTPVQEVMSNEVCYCFEDQEIDEVCANMADIKVRRLLVVDRDKRLVGMISLGDIALADESAAARALVGISKQGGAHPQSKEGSQQKSA